RRRRRRRNQDAWDGARLMATRKAPVVSRGRAKATQRSAEPKQASSDVAEVVPESGPTELEDPETDTAADLVGDGASAGNGSEPAGEEEAAGIDLVGDAEVGASDESVEDTGAFLKGLVEALIFVSDRPLELKELARAARIDRKRAAELVEELRAEYASRGIRLDEVSGGYAFRSGPAYANYVRNFLSLRPIRLSRAQLETLSIVAYRQPITRPEIDDIRGVDCGPVLKGLLERDLIRIIGKKDEPGRPMLYGTTQSFLETFSLKSLRDLPTLREFTELSDESREVFASETGEEAPEGPLPSDEEGPASEGADGTPAQAATDPGGNGEERAPGSEPAEAVAADPSEDDEDDEE
ncbi:MAG TPA: SMC-Scp complex subunit ScpB, partial [Polyangiaceae bacterium]|nr:SMC-Scp complex subunit ScpB [Polyangiaceae bacterium]